jgi:pimeloyl-ACP methyl ester carboxylesterase
MQDITQEPGVETIEHLPRPMPTLTLVGIEKRAREPRYHTAVLMIHGSGCGYPYFDIPAPGYGMMDHLASRGCRVFAFDLPGYGNSTKLLARSFVLQRSRSNSAS